MGSFALVAALAASIGLASAQAAASAGGNGGCGINGPLINQNCPYPYAGPYQVDQQGDQPRGPQSGYNICNSTTEGPNSMCVNSVMNDISDFCVYSNSKMDLIANGEGETVAYCSQKGHGTRYIPSGAITGIQVVKTPGYVAWGIVLDQTAVNDTAGDSGGELDPHGADLRGNPIGGIMYSKAFSASGDYQQIAEWHEFIGGGVICQKICDPTYTDPRGNLCENRFDTVGCMANVPLDYAKINGTFQTCQGENQDIPNGSQLNIPATSACQTHASSEILPGPSAVGGVSGASSASATPAPTGASDSKPAASASSSSSESSAGFASPATSSLSAVVLVGFASLVGAAAVLL